MNGSESIRVANAVWSGKLHFLPQGVSIFSGAGQMHLVFVSDAYGEFSSSVAQSCRLPHNAGKSSSYRSNSYFSSPVLEGMCVIE